MHSPFSSWSCADLNFSIWAFISINSVKHYLNFFFLFSFVLIFVFRSDIRNTYFGYLHRNSFNHIYMLGAWYLFDSVWNIINFQLLAYAETRKISFNSKNEMSWDDENCAFEKGPDDVPIELKDYEKCRCRKFIPKSKTTQINNQTFKTFGFGCDSTLLS